jgi:hypothetical protein
MRGGGGGGGQGGGGDSLRLEQQPCVASRKLVLGLKGILADRMELEIYSMPLDCTMDPDIAVERLISQGIVATSSRSRVVPYLPPPRLS